LRGALQPPDVRGPENRRQANIAGCASVLLLLVCSAGALPAQDQESAPPPAGRSGLELRSVSASFDYYSSGLSTGSTGQYPVKYQPDGAPGGSVQVGWLRSGERNTSSFIYTSSLTGRLRYSELNAWNHAFSLTASHHVSPRTIFNFSAAGDVSNLEQSLFSPTTLSNIASSRATLDDLAGAMLASKFSNPQLTSLLNSAPLVESPLRNLLYGQRMFTSAAKASVSYSYSPRLSLSFQAGGGRNQYLSGSLTHAMLTSYMISNTTSGNAEVSASYSLSPRTQVGGSVGTQRILSSLQDSYATTSLVTLSRQLARRWLLQMHGGAGVLTPVGQVSSVLSNRSRLLATSLNPAGGASLAFKTNSQSILSSIEHTVSDSYGLGAATSTSAALSWYWRRPGRAWWLESSAGWQQLQGNGLARLSGLRTTAGLGRNLGTQLVLLTQYAYLSYSSQLQTPAYRQGQSAVRVALVWSPHGEVSR